MTPLDAVKVRISNNAVETKGVKHSMVSPPSPLLDPLSMPTLTRRISQPRTRSMRSVCPSLPSSSFPSLSLPRLLSRNRADVPPIHAKSSRLSFFLRVFWFATAFPLGISCGGSGPPARATQGVD